MNLLSRTSRFPFKIISVQIWHRFPHSKPACTSRVKRDSRLYAIVMYRAELSARREHGRLIIQHNLDARVKHRFRLRKGIDRDRRWRTPHARSLLYGKKGSPYPRSYLNLFRARLRSNRGRHRAAYRGARYISRFSRRFNRRPAAPC